MRGAPTSFGGEVGDDPRVIGSGTEFTQVRLNGSILTLHGTVRQRRALVLEMARELGMTPAALFEELEATS